MAEISQSNSGPVGQAKWPIDDLDPSEAEAYCSLIDACNEGDLEAVRRLLEEGRNANEVNEEGESLLSLACSSGFLELAQLLLATRANVEDRGLKETTPLMEAASAGHEEIVKLLLHHGADVNAQTSQGNTPLMYAASGSTSSHEAVVRLLLEHGANVSDCNENGHTPLMEAASAGNVSIARILVGHGASINTHSNEFKESALTLACYKGHLEMVRFLLEAGADQEHKTEEMHTALMEASMDGHVEVARLLLDSGAQVNMPADSFESPLTLAACGGHTELAMLLLDRGANIEEVNDEGYTPLMEAAREGHEDMVALLLSQGADINAQTDETQETALTLACCGGFLEVADFLIKAGADIEAGANTPLAEAAQEGHLELVKHLIAAGAQVNAASATGDTPLMYACENGHTDVMEVLLEAGADLEQEAEGGRTPLMKACRAGHLCAVQYLVSKGANVNRVTTNNDHTPLSLACAGGHMAIVEFILAHGADSNHRLKDNSSMLIEAAKGGHTQVVQLLIGHPGHRTTLQGASPPSASACVTGPTAADSGTCGSSQLPSSSCSSDPRSLSSTTSSNSSSNASSTKICAPSTTSNSDTAAVSRSSAQPENTSSSQRSSGIRKATSTITSGSKVPSKPTGSSCSPASLPVSASSSRKGSTSSCGRGDDDGKDVDVLGQAVTSSVMQSVVGNMVAAVGQESPPSHQMHLQTTSPSGDVDLTRRETERLEECVNKMMKRTEMLNPSREEQILQKQQILEELQRVERELHSKTRNSQNRTQHLSQAIADIDPKDVSSILSDSLFAMMSDIAYNQPNSPCAPQIQAKNDVPETNMKSSPSIPSAGDMSRLRGINTATSAAATPAAPASSTSSSCSPSTAAAAAAVAETKRVTVKAKKKSTSSSSSTVSSQATSSPCAPSKQPASLQQQQTSQQPAPLTFESLDMEVEKLNLRNSSVSSEVQSPEAESQTPASNPNDIQVVQQLFQKHWNLIGTRVEEMAAELRPYFEEAVASGIFNEDLTKPASAQPVASPIDADKVDPTTNLAPGYPGEAVVPASHSPPASMTLPSLTSQQLNQLRQQFVAAAGHTSADGHASRTTLKKRPLDVSDSSDHSSLPSISNAISTRLIPSRNRASTSGSSPASSSTTATYAAPSDHSHPPQMARRSKPIASSVASQTVIDANHLDGLTPVKMSNFPASSKTTASSAVHSATSSNINNNQQQQQQQQQQVSTSCSVSSSASSGPSIPSPPPLFSQNIEIDGQTDSNHDTALTFACAGGHEELVLLLLARGSNFEHRDKKGFTPLMIAATTGHANVCEILLKHGADIEAQSDRTKDTALSLACSSGRYEVVDLLLNRGANKEHRNVSDYTPLSLAASGGYVNIIKLLLQHGAEINSRTGSKLGISPLMLAAMNGHASTVKLLLDMGSDINAQIETNRNTALTLACFQGRCEVVALLLDRKANVEHRAKTGLTPLMEAASGGYVEVGRILLDKGADVNAPPVPSSRDTALTIAADKGHFRFVELLIKRGGPTLNLDARNKKGSTPLWLAANGGHLDVVQLLVSSGADIDAQDNRKVSCLMAAFRRGHLKVVKWMVRHVTQFPSDQEMARYLALVNDEELLKKCNSCLDVIRLAKEKQAAEANKNANILLEELDKEKMLIEKKKESAAKKREKKKQKKKDKKEKAKTTTSKVESTSNKKTSNQSKSNTATVAGVSDDDISDEDDYSDDEDSLNVPAPDSTDVQVVPTPSVAVTSTLTVQNGTKKGSSSSASTPASTAAAAAAAASNHSSNSGSRHQSPIKENITPTPSSNKSKKVANEVTVPEVKNTKPTQQVDGNQVTSSKNAKNTNATAAATIRDITPVAHPPAAESKSTVKLVKTPATLNKKQQVVSQSVIKSLETTSTSRSKKEPLEPIAQDTNTVVSKSETLPVNGSDAPQLTSLTKSKKQVASLPASSTVSSIKSTSSSTTSSSKEQIISATTITSNLLHEQQDHEWTEVSRKQRRISVPSTAISRVIGRAGCNINAVREYSGAHIEVEKQKTQQADRLIIIRGSAEATKTAQLMINALVNEPDTDLMQIVAKLGLDEPGTSEKIEDFACTNLRAKSGSMSKSASSKSTASCVIFPQSTSCSASTIPSTVSSFTTKLATTASPSIRTSTPSTPFASTWQPTTALTKSPATVRAANVNSPIKPIAISASSASTAATPVQGADVSSKSFSPVTSSSRPSSQPYPPISPSSFVATNTAAAAVTQQAKSSTGGEYTPFTPSLFGKVGWASPKDSKLNFATVAARGSTAYPSGSGASTSPSASLTSALTINAGQSSSSLVDTSPPLVIAEPSKAPGFRGTFVSPPSSSSTSTTNSCNTATGPLRAASPVSPQSVSTSPSMVQLTQQQQQQQPQQQVQQADATSLLSSAPLQQTCTHSPSMKPSFNLAPGSRSNVTSSNRNECLSDLTSPIIDQYRSQSIDQQTPVSSSVQSSLNPNAQTYAPDPLVSPASLATRSVGAANASAVFQATKQQMAAARDPPVAFNQIPNPQLQMQMRAAILAAGASLQMQTLQAQQAAAAQQQAAHQQAHQKAMLHQPNASFSMGQPDFTPPSAETLRLLQTALMTSASASVPMSHLSTGNQVNPIVPPQAPPAPIGSRAAAAAAAAAAASSMVNRKVAESSISSTMATSAPSDPSSGVVSSLDSEKSLPRPIGTERAQKKHPSQMTPFGPTNTLQQHQAPPNDLWPLEMNTVPPGLQTESDWLNPPFNHASDVLIPNLLQSSINSRSFEAGMVDPSLEQTFQVLSHEPHAAYADANGSFQTYSSGNASAMMPFINGGLIPSHHHSTSSTAPMSSQIHHQYMQASATAAPSSQGPPNVSTNELDYLTHFSLGSSNWRN